MRVAAGSFLSRTMYDPIRTGVALGDDPELAGKGALSLRGGCWRGVVEVADLGIGR